MRRALGAETWLAGLVVSVVLMLVLPLPTALLDLLLATNLAVSLLLLLSAISARSPLALSSLPTLLLVTTLFRLALNVGSTRLILLSANAGRVIAAFGEFVVQGNYAVGAIVFLVLTIVQYLVIARGSERVAEVAARFALDALPGRQMAIDAELRAGALTAEEARRRRSELSRESSLYGALDGAMKFVKGDAIAGIVILVVNLVGGVGIGVGLRGLGVRESLETYGLLTIGDGLVTQIPSLLVSTAAGIVVTRVASSDAEGTLGADIAAQVLGSPRVLVLAALALAVLAVVPGMPTLPFGVLALALAALAFYARRLAGARAPSATPVVVEIGSELGRAEAAEKLLADATRRAEEELGVPLPAARVVSGTSARGLAIRVDGLVLGAREASAGSDAATALATLLVDAVRADVRLTIGPDEVGAMLDALGRERPALVRQSVPRPLTVAALTEVVRGLVAEGVPPRPFALVVEAAAQATDPAQRLELARSALRRAITARWAPSGVLDVIELDAMLEDAIRDAILRQGTSVHLALSPAIARDAIDALRRAAATTPARTVVVSADVRPHLRRLIASDLPEIRVLAPRELEASTQLRTVARASV
ncbi:MAG: FHIPEP family type III secretion protein [Sandaracinus sp.]